MHGSPPCALTVARFGAWRAAVAALALAALASLIAWTLTSPLGGGTWARAGVVLAALATLALAASLWRQPAVGLRWDGLAWTVEWPASAHPVSGRLEIAIDLGSFLLLRFTPAGRSGPAWSTNGMPFAAPCTRRSRAPAQPRRNRADPER